MKGEDVTEPTKQAAQMDISSITGIAFSPQYRSYQRGFFDPSFQC